MRWLVATLAALLLPSCSHPHTTTLGGFEGIITLHTVEAAGKEREFTVTAKGDKLRVDLPPPSVQPAAGDVTLGHAVYDHATNKVLLFFDSTKEYREMDLSKHIAPDAPTTPLEKLGSHRTVAGYPCDEWSVKAADGGRTDVCLADGLAYLEIFRVKYGEHGAESPLARAYRERSVFPLEMIEFAPDGKELARMLTTKIQSTHVDDDAFARPDAYAKVDPHFGPPSHSH